MVQTRNEKINWNENQSYYANCNKFTVETAYGIYYECDASYTIFTESREPLKIEISAPACANTKRPVRAEIGITGNVENGNRKTDRDNGTRPL